jgi:hypothetical protein
MEHGQMARLGWRRPIAYLLFRGHVDKRLSFIAEVVLRPISTNEPDNCD